MPSTLELVTASRHRPQDLFDLSLDVGTHVDSMRGSREQAVGGVTQGRLGPGDTVTWRGRHLGVYFRMTVRVTVFDRPHRFVDEQVSGPFRMFRHEHLYEAANGGTRMVDRITLASPVGGRLVERGLLVPHLRRIVAQRNAVLVAELDRRAAHRAG
ncbi:cyclase [Kytococcus sedentarius]|uniref:SRPBCC family protein n=1 Tax=Kytococcus sedentarius TaxID=1276 RepID=UPI0035BC1DB2